MKCLMSYCTDAQHATLHRYARTVFGRTQGKRGAGIGPLLWHVSIGTLFARAVRFHGLTFSSPEGFARAVEAERAWITRQRKEGV